MVSVEMQPEVQKKKLILWYDSQFFQFFCPKNSVGSRILFVIFPKSLEFSLYQISDSESEKYPENWRFCGHSSDFDFLGNILYE